MTCDFPQIENFTSAAVRVLKNPEIILFGSRWLGNSRPDSDVDLVVVSESFHGIGLAERRAIIKEAVVDLGWRDHDLILRSPKDWLKVNWLRDAVESQVHEKDTWREMFERFGKRPVLRALNRARRRSSAPVDMADIAAELATLPDVCPRCSSPMQGGCRRSCPQCGLSEGCGG